MADVDLLCRTGITSATPRSAWRGGCRTCIPRRRFVVIGAQQPRRATPNPPPRQHDQPGVERAGTDRMEKVTRSAPRADLVHISMPHLLLWPRYGRFGSFATVYRRSDTPGVARKVTNHRDRETERPKLGLGPRNVPRDRRRRRRCHDSRRMGDRPGTRSPQSAAGCSQRRRVVRRPPRKANVEADDRFSGPDSATDPIPTATDRSSVSRIVSRARSYLCRRELKSSARRGPFAWVRSSAVAVARLACCACDPPTVRVAPMILRSREQKVVWAQ